MKKKNLRQRKLRKCELGKKTKKHNWGCRHVLTDAGWMPRHPAWFA